MEDYQQTSEENNTQSSEEYDYWMKTLGDVEFRGDKPQLHSSESDEPATETNEHQSNPNVNEVIQKLCSSEMERSGEAMLRPRAEIICDRNHIENQRIDAINKIDEGKIEFRLKLREPNQTIASIIAELNRSGDNSITTSGGTELKHGQIKYQEAYGDASQTLCDAYILERDDVKISIADPAHRNGTNQDLYDELIQTALGLITVEVSNQLKPEAIEATLRGALEGDLSIPGALDEVSEEAEEEYKLARYKWCHKIDGDLTPEQNEQAKNLVREEVFPGYTTLVEQGKHKEYLKQYGEDIRAIHRCYDASRVYPLLTAGLMSTTERYARGIVQQGKSSHMDIDTGGADSVFTRILTKEQRETSSGSSIGNGITVKFKPEIFDRTDWYSYDYDCCGSTHEEDFARRRSPDEIFQKVATGSPGGNEQMFRTGIGTQYIESIETSAWYRQQILDDLKSKGLLEFNGKPIEELIVLRPN